MFGLRAAGVLSGVALEHPMTETVEVPKAKLERLEKLAPLADLADELGGVGELMDAIRAGKEFLDFRPGATRDIAELKKAVSFDGSNGETTDEETASDAPEAPIERVQQLDDQDHGINVTPSVRRAVALYENLRAWGVKTPRGHVLKTKNNLRSLLSAETEENLKWKQVYRACEALDDLAKGGVEYHENNPRHGKMLVIPAQSDGHSQPSSAAT